MLPTKCNHPQQLHGSNEGAEHAVKLVAHFLGLPKSEDKFQSNLQVVETHQKETPNLCQPSKRRKQ